MVESFLPCVQSQTPNVFNYEKPLSPFQGMSAHGVGGRQLSVGFAVSPFFSFWCITFEGGTYGEELRVWEGYINCEKIMVADTTGFTSEKPFQNKHFV